MPIINNIHRPEEYFDIKNIRDAYLKNGYLLISLDNTKKINDAKKIKDYLLGITYSKQGLAYQYQKHLLFILNQKHAPNDITKLSSFLWEEK